MPTMHDVAKQAGVSLSTVSYALSGKRTISEATRKRVLDAVRDLDFQPHPHGRALASRRSNTIALVFPALCRGIGGMQLEFVSAAATAAAEHGYAFLISISPDQDAEVVHLARQGFTDGLILMEITLDDRRVDLLRERGVPFAMIGHRTDNTGLSFVDFDFVDAAERALNYLAGLGHRDIAFVGGSDAQFATGYGPVVRARAGFDSAVAAHDLDAVWLPSEPTPRAAHDVVSRLLRERPTCTAILTAQTECIGGIIQAAGKAGRHFPNDLSLVAFTSPTQAEGFVPTVTTMDFPAADMGRLGAELLVRQFEGWEGGESSNGPAAPVQRLLRATLTVRESSGPAPG